MPAPRSDIVPSLSLAFGAALWGLYWIPVRAIEQAGVQAMWTGPIIFGASALLFLPLLILRFRHYAAHVLRERSVVRIEKLPCREDRRNADDGRVRMGGPDSPQHLLIRFGRLHAVRFA